MPRDVTECEPRLRVGEAPVFFISYKSQEFEQASDVRRTLEANGLSCWMAPDSIEPGSEYGKQITDAIRKSDGLVLILSELSQSSMPVLSEVDLAMTFKKTIIPFHIDRSELTDAFLFRIGIVQRIEAADDLDDAYQDLIARARNLLEERALEPSEESAPSQAGSRAALRASGGAAAGDKTPACASGLTEGKQRSGKDGTDDVERLAGRTGVLAVLLLAVFSLFVWASTLEGAFDNWPIYAMIAVAMVFINNLTVNLYRLIPLWGQHAQGVWRRVLEPRTRRLILLALTVPALVFSAYADRNLAAAPAATSVAVLLLFEFFDLMELSKMMAEASPRLVRVVNQAVACILVLFIGVVGTVVFFLSANQFSIQQVVGVAFVSAGMAGFGGLLALLCNAVLGFARRLVAIFAKLSRMSVE